MDYTKKYLEYKEKYIQLKNQLKNQSGGGDYIAPLTTYGISDRFLVANNVPFVPLAPVIESINTINGPVSRQIIQFGPTGPILSDKPLLNQATVFVPVDQYSTPLHYNPYPPKPLTYYDTGVYNPKVYYDDDISRRSKKSSRRSSRKSSRKSSRRNRK
jgi:hypothetical protein